MSFKLRILSFDPGTKNFAFSVIDFNLKTKKVKLVDIGTLTVDESPLTYCVNFQKTFSKVVKAHDIDFVVAERFMFRGSSSVHSEKVNFLLGLASSILAKRGLSLFLVPASLWKRFYTWKGKKGKDKNIVVGSPYGKHVFDTAHESDAAHLGYWYMIRGVFNHLTAVKTRLNTPEPVFKCKNCKYWLWEKHNKNQVPCSEQDDILPTDYCSDFKALKFTVTPKLFPTEKRLLDLWGWKSLKEALKKKKFNVSRSHAWSDKHNVLFSIKTSGKKFKKLKKLGYSVVPITDIHLDKVSLEWKKLKVKF